MSNTMPEYYKQTLLDDQQKRVKAFLNAKNNLIENLNMYTEEVINELPKGCCVDYIEQITILSCNIVDRGVLIEEKLKKIKPLRKKIEVQIDQLQGELSKLIIVQPND